MVSPEEPKTIDGSRDCTESVSGTQLIGHWGQVSAWSRHVYCSHVEHTKYIPHLDSTQRVQGPSPRALSIFCLSLHVRLANPGCRHAICLAQQSVSTLSVELGALDYWPHHPDNFGVRWFAHDSMEHHQSFPIHRSLARGAFRITGRKISIRSNCSHSLSLARGIFYPACVEPSRRG